jgi:hypothetical protein
MGTKIAGMVGMVYTVRLKRAGRNPMRVQVLLPAPFTVHEPDGKAAVLHTAMTVFDSLMDYHYPSLAQRQSNRPIIDRPRIVTVRKDQTKRKISYER